jgi:ankyrin repeat protein
MQTAKQEHIMSCSHASSCELYSLMAMEPALNLWKNHFCDGGHEKCARFQLSLSGKMVPLTLLPNGKQLAPRSKAEINASALFNAIQKQRVPMIRSMLKTNINPKSAVTSDGTTPTMAAAAIGNVEILKLLLDKGCNPFSKNKSGETALDIAVRGSHAECETILRNAMSSSSPDEYDQQDVSLPAVGNDEEEDQLTRENVIGFLRKLNPFKN